jgi:hypothetical protein
LHINGLTYAGFGLDSPNDVKSRLHWIGLEGSGFHSQPFSQLASAYKSSGSIRQATQVLIAMEDERYS